MQPQPQPSSPSEKEQHETLQQKIKSWGRRLLDPSIIARFHKNHGSPAGDDLDAFPLLSYPWKLSVRQTPAENSSSDDHHMLSVGRKYPKASHLVIRQTQNEAFCQDRFHRGMAATKQGNLNEARACYQEGLDLMPDHADLLAAMGALLANQRNFLAAQELLERALAVDAQHTEAAKYLAQVRAATTRSTKTAKSVAATQDVRMEQSLLGRNTTAQTSKSVATSGSWQSAGGAGTAAAYGNTQYELLLDDSDEDRVADKHKKAKKRKDRKKRKRGHKRDKRERDNSDDSTSVDSDYYSRKKRRRRKKKSKKLHKTTSSNDASNLSTSSSDTVDSLKLVPVKIAHKPKK